jgi:hypothetical protein
LWREDLREGSAERDACGKRSKEKSQNFHSLRSPLNSDSSLKIRLDWFDLAVTVDNLRS